MIKTVLEARSLNLGWVAVAALVTLLMIPSGSQAETGLISYWSFDNGDATDDFGNNDGLLMNGVTPTTGIVGGAMLFDGTDDYIDCGNDASLNPADALTVEAWVKPYEGVNGYILAKPDHWEGGAYALEIMGSYNAVNLWLSHSLYLVNFVVPLDVWSHIAYTYDSTEGKVKCYVNAVLKGTWNRSGPIAVNEDALWIGRRRNDFSFKGIIDEVAIYNRALTADEIQKHYDSPGSVIAWPTADAGGPYVETARSWDGAAVNLSGLGSSDPEGQSLTYHWDLDLSVDGPDEDDDPTNDVDAMGPTPVGIFMIGQTEISLVVIDTDGLPSDPDVTTVTVSTIDVAIDIKPGSYPNSINMGSHGVIPVAFLTGPEFDASTIDPLTVTLRGEDFADGLVKLRGKKDVQPMANLEDVDGDGDMDLVVHLETEKLAEYELDALCELGALTYDGYVVSGMDTINIVPSTE